MRGDEEGAVPLSFLKCKAVQVGLTRNLLQDAPGGDAKERCMAGTTLHTSIGASQEQVD